MRPEPSTRSSVGLIEDTAAFAALEPEWDALWRATEGACPFQHPAWLLPWWGAFGTARLRVAYWRAEGRLAGLFPAYVLEEADGPKLLPVGAGTTDHLDALGAGAEPMLHAVLDRVGSEGVRRADLIDVPPRSGLPGTAVPPGWSAAWAEGAACPVAPTGAIPPGVARKLRMNRNRAGRAGGWAVREAGAAGFETVVALHQARWAADGEPGILADMAVLACLRSVMPRLEAAGLLRLAVLEVAGVAAAATLALLSPGRIWFYATGYDAEQAFVSPGTLLLGAMLEQAAAEGRPDAHFLRGQEGYKYAWGGVDQMNRDGRFTRV